MTTNHKTMYFGASEGKKFFVVGSLVTVKLTGQDTNGAYSVWLDTVLPGGGPPPHTQPRG